MSLRTATSEGRTRSVTARTRRITAGTLDRMRRTIAAIGRTLVTIGLLILLFVAYQLWGTGIFTARAQHKLKNAFAAEQQAYDRANHVAPTTSTDPGTTVPSRATTTTTLPKTSAALPPPPIPADGQAEGWITIPKIGLHMIFVEGTTRDDLEKGPGHYPATPMPGTIGDAAIAGHRTTYLHPFGDIDHLKAGDDIFVQTVAGTFDYAVYHAPLATGGNDWEVVPATDVGIVADHPTDAELTLTSCHPKHYAEHRIVIKARLVVRKSSPPAKPRPRPETTEHGKGRPQPVESLADGLSGQQRSLQPSIVWGILVALVGLAWWWAFRRFRHPMTWMLGVVPFLIALFPFFVYLERALPSGY